MKTTSTSLSLYTLSKCSLVLNEREGRSFESDESKLQAYRNTVKQIKPEELNVPAELVALVNEFGDKAYVDVQYRPDFSGESYREKRVCLIRVEYDLSKPESLWLPWVKTATAFFKPKISIDSEIVRDGASFKKIMKGDPYSREIHGEDIDPDSGKTLGKFTMRMLTADSKHRGIWAGNNLKKGKRKPLCREAHRFLRRMWASSRGDAPHRAAHRGPAHLHGPLPPAVSPPQPPEPSSGHAPSARRRTCCTACGRAAPRCRGLSRRGT